jgi:hypothetical protein
MITDPISDLSDSQRAIALSESDKSAMRMPPGWRVIHLNESRSASSIVRQPVECGRVRVNLDI